jgi:hypothetical protein
MRLNIFVVVSGSFAIIAVIAPQQGNNDDLDNNITEIY